MIVEKFTDVEEYDTFEAHAELWRYNLDLDENGLFLCPFTQRAYNAFIDGWKAYRQSIKIHLPYVNDYDSSVELREYIAEQLDNLGISYE